MLKELYVKNFAIIVDLNISFDVGMTVLTGQTGAGKSLIIDSLNLLLGARSDTDMIRHGEQTAVVRGTFQICNELVPNLLEQFGIPYSNEITITRELSMTGKNTVKANQTTITLGQLKALGYFLGDIHEQHDTYRLINKDNYLYFLTDLQDKKFVSLSNQFQIMRNEHENALEQYKQASIKNKYFHEKYDFLKFQMEEIGRYQLHENEDSELLEEIDKLSNFDTIYQNLNDAYAMLDGDEFSLSTLFSSANHLEKIGSFDPEYHNWAKALQEAYYLITETKSELYRAKDALDFDPMHLETLQRRLHEIEKLKEKYKMSLIELIEYHEKVSLEISLFEHYDDTMLLLKGNAEKAFKKALEAAKLLSHYRKEKALKLEHQLISICQDLDLPNTKFQIDFEPYPDENDFLVVLPNDGIDTVDFMISLNKGEPLKPLAKVASGGELSRIMLALKSIYLEKHTLSFMVFDEIDAGISGSTALKIAKKMHDLSKQVQVLCITHLAQVASIADQHLFISKEEENGRTITKIAALQGEDRVREIATMLSGLELNHAVLETARELLKIKGL